MLTWNNEDGVTLRDYLATTSGNNLIENLKSIFVVLEGKDNDEVLRKASKRAGQEEIVNTILANAKHNEKPEAEITSYVNVDDSPR